MSACGSLAAAYLGVLAILLGLGLIGRIAPDGYPPVVAGLVTLAGLLALVALLRHADTSAVSTVVAAAVASATLAGGLAAARALAR